MKIAFGLMLGLLIGVGCRWLDIPVPSPPKLVGALLVVAMTLGYVATDRFLVTKAATTAHLCGGPTGVPIAQDCPPTAGGGSLDPTKKVN